MYHWDVLVTYHWKVIGYFIWDLLETSWRYTDLTSLLRPLETSSWRSNKTLWKRASETSWWRSAKTSLGVSFETHLRRCWDLQRDVITTSSRRLVVGWVVKNVIYLIILILWPVLNLEALGFVSAFQAKLSNHH